MPTETLLVSLFLWDSFMSPCGHLTTVVIFVAVFWCFFFFGLRGR